MLKKPTIKSTKTLHNKAWKLQSEWIRRKDANLDGNVYCYTCDKAMHWKESHAGHFKHGKLDFDDRNLKVQCPGCNTYRDGRLDVYALRLLKDYGKKWILKLESDALQTTPYTWSQLQEIIIELKLKLSKLK